MSLPALRLIAKSAPRPIHLVHGGVEASFLYDEIDVSLRSPVPVAPGRYSHRVGIDAVRLDRRYDCFVSLATWDGPEVCELAARARAKVKIGFFSWCTLRLGDQPAHDLARMFALASLFEPGARLLNFAHSPAFKTRKTRGAGRVLAVHGDTRAEKVWPLDRYDRVLTEFLRANQKWRVVALNFSPDQLPDACATNRMDLVKGVALSEAMRRVAAADLFLGVDSCMLHVADLCKIPGVALFGPTRAEQFGYCVTPRSRVRNLQANAAITEISIAQVGEALEVVRKRVER